MKLVVFDLEGVLVDIDSSWQLVHRAFGTDNEENFQRYLRGEIDYREFMRTEIGLWGRANITQIKNILDEAPLMDSAPRVVEELKKAGCKTAIITSGISILADRVREMLKIDHSYAIRLLTDERGQLSGESEEVIDLSNKGEVLKRLAEEEDVSLKQCALIGGSGFDISLFKEVGLSITFNTRDEKVREAADLVIEDKDLGKVLPWLKSRNLTKVNSSLSLSSVVEARAAAGSVSPDNLRTPAGLFVKTWSERESVNIKIVSIRRIETVLATLDDLFACLQVAEGAIKATAKK